MDQTVDIISKYISLDSMNVKEFGESDQIYSWETWAMNCSAELYFSKAVPNVLLILKRWSTKHR